MCSHTLETRHEDARALVAFARRLVHCISSSSFSKKNAVVYHFCHGCLCSNFSFELGIEILFLLYVVLQ